MISTLMLIVLTTAPYLVPQATPSGVARCLKSHAEKLSASNETAAAIADKAMATCKEPFEQMLAARDAAVAKEAEAPVPEWNSAEWRASMTSHFKQTALHYVEMARRTR